MRLARSSQPEIRADGPRVESDEQGCPRERRLEHDAANAGVRDGRVVHNELLEREAAHRVTHEQHVAEVEPLQDRPQIGPEVVDRVPRRTGDRLAVTPMVEGDDAEPPRRERFELLHPDARVDRDAVREHDGRAAPAADRVEAPAVVTLEAVLLVEAQRAEPAGVGIRAVAEAPGEGALRAVRRARGTRGDTRGDPDRLQDALAGAHVV